jgi:hypothetical protein
MNDLSDCKIKGEAVVVEIPHHRSLFLVFDAPGKRSQAEMVRSLLAPVSADPLQAWNYDLPARWRLTDEYIPLMVTFKDQSDPFSVTKVDPGNLSRELGPGVRLTSVDVQKTNDHVTFGKVEKAIPWIKDPKFDFHRNSSENRLSQTLTTLDFISRN